MDKYTENWNKKTSKTAPTDKAKDEMKDIQTDIHDSPNAFTQIVLLDEWCFVFPIKHYIPFGY